MSHENPRTLDTLEAPDELTCRRLLSLLGTSGGVADDRAA